MVHDPGDEGEVRRDGASNCDHPVFLHLPAFLVWSGTGYHDHIRIELVETVVSVLQLDPDRSWLSAAGRVLWRSAQVAVAILVIVVPFAYGITSLHYAVLMAAGSGFAVGVGLSLRMGDRAAGRPAS